jgi:predicted dehydrogenase
MTNRRNFLKKAGLAGAGLIGYGSIGCNRTAGSEFPAQKQSQIFNMSGYAAPKLDAVRTAVIGLGNRGLGTVTRIACIEGVEIRALCDLEPGKVRRAMESISDIGHRPDSYSGGPDEWRKICERPDIDLVAIVTPWDSHTEMCVYAMDNEKHAYVELPAATTVEDCWRLVEASERNRRHCVQVSTTGHGYAGTNRLEPVVLNMVRKGFFGDIVHAEGSYIHQLLFEYLFSKTMYPGQWRLKENIGRNGNLYPQHGFVPILQMLDVNYGDRMDYMTSVSSNDFMMAEVIERLSEDKFWEPYMEKKLRGDINTTIIRTVKGRTIVLQHDTSTPRPGERFQMISGTKGAFRAPNRFAVNHHRWIPDEELKSLTEQYMPELARRFNEFSNMASRVETRRGGYFRTDPLDWRLIDCLRNGLPMDLDVYEAAASSVITPLSEWSVANRSNSVDIPDFTCGAWQTNKRGMDMDLERGGGNTRLI